MRIVLQEDAAPFDADASVGRLHRVAAASILLLFPTGFVGPQALVAMVDYDTELAGGGRIAFIGQNRIWRFAPQNLTMGSMVFLIVPLSALWPAPRHGDPVVAAVGIVLAVACQVLVMACFRVANGLLRIAQRHAEASDPAARTARVGGAEALVATNSADGTSDGIFALGIHYPWWWALLTVWLVGVLFTFRRLAATDDASPMQRS